MGLPVGSGLHLLRHTFASRAIKNGVNVKALQEWLGHENISETLDTYGHLFENDLSDYAQVIDNAFAVEMNALVRGDTKLYKAK
jgi:integrase